MKNNFVVVLRTTMTLEQAEMARIQGVNVRAMAGEDMSTRTARRLWCAWLYSQSRGAGAARGGVGGRGRFFPRQRILVASVGAAMAAPVGDNRN